MGAAELERSLAVFVHLASAELPHTQGPEVVVSTYSGVEVAKDEDCLLCWDVLMTAMRSS